MVETEVCKITAIEVNTKWLQMQNRYILNFIDGPFLKLVAKRGKIFMKKTDLLKIADFKLLDMGKTLLV